MNIYALPFIEFVNMLLNSLSFSSKVQRNAANILGRLLQFFISNTFRITQLRENNYFLLVNYFLGSKILVMRIVLGLLRQ